MISIPFNIWSIISLRKLHIRVSPNYITSILPEWFRKKSTLLVVDILRRQNAAQSTIYKNCLRLFEKISKSLQVCLLSTKITHCYFILLRRIMHIILYVKVIDISVGTTLQGTTTILFNYVRDTSKITILF